MCRRGINQVGQVAPGLSNHLVNAIVTQWVKRQVRLRAFDACEMLAHQHLTPRFGFADGGYITSDGALINLYAHAIKLMPELHFRMKGSPQPFRIGIQKLQHWPLIQHF